jgi:hypothetical protein
MIVRVLIYCQRETSQSHLNELKLEVSQNGDVLIYSEIGLSVKMFRHIDQTALWCSLFKSRVLIASRLKTDQSGKSLDTGQLWCR